MVKIVDKVFEPFEIGIFIDSYAVYRVDRVKENGQIEYSYYANYNEMRIAIEEIIKLKTILALDDKDITMAEYMEEYAKNSSEIIEVIGNEILKLS